MTAVHSLIRRFRIASFVSGTSGLLLIPCVVLSSTFFFLDEHYRYAVNGPEGGTKLSADYRAAAAPLDMSQGFQCHSVGHELLLDRGGLDPRDVELVAMDSAVSSVYWREIMFSETRHWRLIVWVENLDLSLLQRVREIRRRYREGSTPFELLNANKLRPYCQEQDIRRASEEPLLPPIELAGEIRSLLLRAADRMDEAVAAYEEVRPWLLVFFYSWIAYSVVGLLSAIYVVRLTRPYAAAIRAQREAADLPPW